MSDDERLVLVNSDVIEVRRSDDEKPLCYYRGWIYLTIHLDDYQVATTFNFYERDLDSEDYKQRFLDEQSGEIRKSFYDMGDEEKTEYARRHLKYIKRQDQSQKSQIYGTAMIEDRRDIQVISAEIEGLEKDKGYSKYYQKMTVSIYEAEREKEFYGSIYHYSIDEDERKFTDEEDELAAELYLPLGTIDGLVREIEKQKKMVPLSIQLIAHMFQHETHRMFAEPYHPQSFQQLNNGSSSAAVRSIWLDHTRAKKLKENAELEMDIYGDNENSSIDEETLFRSTLIKSVQDIAKPIKRLQYALWIIVVVLFLSILVP